MVNKDHSPMRLKYQVFFYSLSYKMAHRLGMGFIEELNAKQSFPVKIQIIAVAVGNSIFGNAIFSKESSRNWD